MDAATRVAQRTHAGRCGLARRCGRLAAAVALGLAAATGAACPAPTSDLSVGDGLAILTCNPITGPLSHLGPGLQHGMELAADEINAAGGIFGRPLVLLRADTHSDPAAGTYETKFYYERFRDHVFAIAGATGNDVSEALLRDVARNRLQFGQMIPMISPASASPVFSELLDPFDQFFRTVPAANHQGRILAARAGELGYNRAAVVGPDDIFTRRLAEAFRSAFRNGHTGKEIAIQYFDRTSVASINDAVGKAGASQPDVFFIIAYGADGRAVLAQWARRYPDVPLLLSDTLMSDAFVRSLDPTTLARLDAVRVDGVFPGADESAAPHRSFVSRFCASHPDDCGCRTAASGCETGGPDQLRPMAYTANAYDSIYLLALALAWVSRYQDASLSRSADWQVDVAAEAIRSVANDDTGADEPVTGGAWHAALQAISSGSDPDYQGASNSGLELGPTGDPTSGYFHFWTLRDGKIVQTNSDAVTEFEYVSF